MKLSYDNGVAKLKQCWLDNGKSLSFGKLAALNALKKYLTESNIGYSHEEALVWLESNKGVWNNQHYFRNRRALFELNDIMQHGEIVGGYQYYVTPFDNLPDSWKDLLCEYKEDLLTKRKRRATHDQITHCTDFAVFVSGLGLVFPTEITGIVVTKYFNYAVSQGDRFICIYSVRYFLEYLVARGDIPPHRALILTSPLQAEAAGFAFSSIRVGVIAKWKQSISDVRYSPESFWKLSQSMADLMEKNFRYDASGLRNNYISHLQMFYIFASECHLDYMPDIARSWLEEMRSFGDSKAISMRRRCFAIFEIFVVSGELSIPAVITDPGLSAGLTNWSLSLMGKFLDSCEREGLSVNTVSRHRSACISFLLFMQDKGVSAPEQITPQLAKDHNIAVAKASLNGCNNYASSIRRFLSYLEEQSLARKNLALSLPPYNAQSRRIVEVLSDDEIQKIYEYRKNSHTPMELRNSAMLMLGLLLGIRSIDVVNLKLMDLQWKNQSISIIQQKTLRALSLPLPVTVGNSIYKYLKEGRPDSNSEFIFLSSVAPYKRVKQSACSNALNKSLGSNSHSFHALRRTFATRLLNAGVGTDTIKDSLGHSTMDTVSRYLSISEDGIRRCCLPLERTAK